MIFASLLLLLVGVLQVHARCDETFSYIGNSGQIRLTKMCDNGTSFLDFKIETIEERSGPGNGNGVARTTGTASSSLTQGPQQTVDAYGTQIIRVSMTGDMKLNGGISVMPFLNLTLEYLLGDGNITGRAAEKGTFKISFEISGWPFADPSNRLFFESTVLSPGTRWDIDDDNKKVYVEATDNKGSQVFADLDSLTVDGKKEAGNPISNLNLSTRGSNLVLQVTSPAGQKIYYDPQFVLPRSGDTSNAGSVSCSSANMLIVVTILLALFCV